MELLCASDSLLESQSRGFVVKGRKLMATRRHGEVFVYINRCPHRGVPLEWQADDFLDESASLIRCATHGALFLVENGECVAGPCAGRSLIAVSSREDQQGIWIATPGTE